MLNIISRSLLIIFAIAFSACSSKVPVGAHDLHRDAVTDMQATAKALQATAEAKKSPLVEDKPISHEKKRSTDTFESDIAASEDSIYFSFGKKDIDNRGKAVLQRHAIRLKDNPLQVVTVVAFTDNLGSRSFNLAIAEDRIDAVVSTLRALGVPKKRIRRKSAGLSKLSSACSTPDCRKKTRRVELIYK